jgi:putative transposase
VARLMRLAGLAGVHRRRLHGCTKRNEDRQPQPDLVQRQFQRPGPNQLWVADLTQHRTGEGWLYIATVLDVFSRRVVGWATDARAKAELVVNALDMAVWNRRPGQGVIHHSDHGSQYTSVAYTDRLECRKQLSGRTHEQQTARCFGIRESGATSNKPITPSSCGGGSPTA